MVVAQSVAWSLTCQRARRLIDVGSQCGVQLYAQIITTIDSEVEVYFCFSAAALLYLHTANMSSDDSHLLDVVSSDVPSPPNCADPDNEIACGLHERRTESDCFGMGCQRPTLRERSRLCQATRPREMAT